AAGGAALLALVRNGHQRARLHRRGKDPLALRSAGILAGRHRRRRRRGTGALRVGRWADDLPAPRPLMLTMTLRAWAVAGALVLAPIAAEAQRVSGLLSLPGGSPARGGILVVAKDAEGNEV